MAEELTIKVIDGGDDGCLSFSLSGRLTAITAKDFNNFVTEESGKREFTDAHIDMTDLAYIASAGLRVMKTLRKMTRQAGGEVTLNGVSDDVMEVFEITGFSQMFIFE